MAQQVKDPGLPQLWRRFQSKAWELAYATGAATQTYKQKPKQTKNNNQGAASGEA